MSLHIKLSAKLSAKLSPATHTLKAGKNLLGFSGGVDSVALFFLLLELEIPFDIAIVHYHTREQADNEVAYAQELAQKYSKHCFVSHAPHFHSNFESQAREFRFRFFDELIATHGYTALLLAHQLNDHFEWLMMQLTRGAGLENLLGFEGRSYPIFRPLESIPKEELYRFCDSHNLQYFEDSSNQDLHFKRNYFRHYFCNQILKEFAPGIARSLEYLREDRISLQSLSSGSLEHFTLPHTQQQIFVLKKYNQNQVPIDANRLLSGCDKIAKKLGYILSAGQRKEILKSKFSSQIHRLLIASNEWSIFLALLDSELQAPSTSALYAGKWGKKMDKQFKSSCAHYAIPPKLRGLLWQSFVCFARDHLEHMRESVAFAPFDLSISLDSDMPALTSAKIQTDRALQNLFWDKVSKFFKP